MIYIWILDKLPGKRNNSPLLARCAYGVQHTCFADCVTRVDLLVTLIYSSIIVHSWQLLLIKIILHLSF